MLQCNAGDILCEELHKSKSLLRLRVCTGLSKVEHCGITEKGAEKIAEIRQLEGLVLGRQSDYSE